MLWGSWAECPGPCWLLALASSTPPLLPPRSWRSCSSLSANSERERAGGVKKKKG